MCQSFPSHWSASASAPPLSSSHPHSSLQNFSKGIQSPFGNMKLHKQQEPHWVWRFKRREEKLGLIMLSLARSKTDSITDKKAKHCGIQLHPLNYHTGETSPGVTPYFSPTEDDLLVRQPTCLLQKNRFFRTSSRDSTGLSQAKYDRNLRRALTEDLERYRLSAKRRMIIPGLKSFDIHEGFHSLITHSDKKPSISISKAMRIDDGRRKRQCHQIVHLNTDEYPDPARPSITELQVLISVIWDRMRIEKRKIRLKDKLRRYDHSAHKLIHYVVPTLIITMFPGAQARVLYGYFDGKLKVQYTELQQVTTSNFEDMIGSLLKWSLPSIDGDTTDVVTLPVIPEEDEEAGDVVASPPKTIEKAQNPTKKQTDECALCLLPDASVTAASFPQFRGKCAVQSNSNKSSTSLTTIVTIQVDLNTSLSSAQLQTKECARLLLSTHTTNPSTLTTEPSAQQHKYHYPTKRHSCSFHTCTVAAKNLVEERQKCQRNEWMMVRPTLWRSERS